MAFAGSFILCVCYGKPTAKHKQPCFELNFPQISMYELDNGKKTVRANEGHIKKNYFQRGIAIKMRSLFR